METNMRFAEKDPAFESGDGTSFQTRPHGQTLPKRSPSLLTSCLTRDSDFYHDGQSIPHLLGIPPLLVVPSGDSLGAKLNDIPSQSRFVPTLPYWRKPESPQHVAS